MSVLSKHHALSLFVMTALLMPAVVEAETVVASDTPLCELVEFRSSGNVRRTKLPDADKDPTGGKSGAQYCTQFHFDVEMSFPQVADFDKLGELILKSPYAEKLSATCKSILVNDVDAVIEIEDSKPVAVWAITEDDVELITRAYLWVMEQEIQRRQSNPGEFVAKLIAKRDEIEKQVIELDKQIDENKKEVSQSYSQQASCIKQLFGSSESSARSVARIVEDDDIHAIIIRTQEVMANLDIELRGIQAELRQLHEFKAELKGKAELNDVKERKQQWIDEAVYERQLRYVGLNAKRDAAQNTATLAGEILGCQAKIDSITNVKLRDLKRQRGELAGLAVQMAVAANSKNAKWRTEKLVVNTMNSDGVIKVRSID